MHPGHFSRIISKVFLMPHKSAKFAMPLDQGYNTLSDTYFKKLP
jgi:hypothetical protein